jgi:hypothetical protein
LYEAWAVESLMRAKSEIAGIDTVRVRATRRARQSTASIFENHIKNAVDSFTATPNGVVSCIRECFKEQDRYRTGGVEELANLSELGVTIRRRLLVFESRLLSAILGGWLVALLVVIALGSVPATYYLHVYKSSKAPTLTAAAPAVAASASADFARLQAEAMKPDKSTFEKTVSIVEGVWKLVDDIPKITAALAAALGLIGSWFKR